MLWVGLVLVAVGIVLFLLSGRSANKAVAMQATETKRVGDITALIGEISGDLGGGPTGYAELVEIKGHVACDNPIMGELSGKPGAIVATRVERKVETRHEVKDSQGNYRTEWRRTTETLNSHRQEAEFFVDDGTGKIRVQPKGASLDLVKLVDRFEAPNAVENMRSGQLAIRFGTGFSLSVGGLGSDRRTLGYRFVEESLPVGQRVYLLGEVADTDEGLVLRKPSDPDKKQPFILSTKSEEELVKSAKASAKWLKVAAAVLAVGGVVLAVMGAIG